MGMIRSMFGLLDRREQVQAMFLFCLFLLTALSEVVGIASILPFMSVLTDPDSVSRNQWLKRVYDYFEFSSINNFLFFVGMCVLVVLVVTNVIKAATRWATLYLSQSWGQSLSTRLFAIYLGQPYRFFLDRNSSDISKNVLAEVQTLANGVITTCLDMLTRVLVSGVIFIFLMVMDPVLALISTGVLGGAYIGVFLLFKKSLNVQAEQRNQAQAERYKIVNEAIQGIKNIKLTGHENVYSAYFQLPSEMYAKSTAKNYIVGEMPRYALEVIAFGGILLMALYLLLHSSQGVNHVLPMIALYALAGYRLMPNLQGIYNAFTRIRFHKPALDIVRRELALQSTMQNIPLDTVVPISFSKSLSLRNVSFKYGEDGRDILKNINIEIPAGSMTGIVGKTGAGKTTFVDLILGLLEPVSGEVAIDDLSVTADNRRAWQKNLSYVSQHIYLCDDTIAANIAFGIAAKDVDREKLREVSRMASIAEFIESELPKGYDTIVGENGIRLSGGQRQRIGLARALYLNRPVLVLDEATSALDPSTEAEVMYSIHALEKKKTIIIISHKPELLSRCDCILTVQDGTVSASVKHFASETKIHV